MMCVVSWLVLIAIPKVILLYFDFEDYLSKQMNFCWCSLRPGEKAAISALADHSVSGHTGDEQELHTLRRQVGQLTAECKRLRQENADMERTLSYIREIVFPVVQK